ncbi:MAG: ECF-type sigma factor [Phycisphaerae bacterium]
MDAVVSQTLSRLLMTADKHDHETIERLFPQIYNELHRIAQGYMRGESPAHTLQPTALVHEAFVRVQQRGIRVEDERHALAVAAVAMRCILVDHARRRSAVKRGGDAQRLSLDQAKSALNRDFEILELDELITRYAQIDLRRAKVIELRIFGGLTNDEIATALQIARSTVAEDWSVARAWLRMQLQKDAADE